MERDLKRDREIQPNNEGQVQGQGNYEDLLADIKKRIQEAHVRAALAVNRELVLLYWRIGRDILDRQEREGWGGKVVERLAADLRREFPSMHGLSRSNLHYMRAFAEAYPDELFVQQLVGQVPWGHNVYLLDTVKDPAEREWYVRKTIDNGWSRAVLTHHVESHLYRRQGKALSNFLQRTSTTLTMAYHATVVRAFDLHSDLGNFWASNRCHNGNAL